MAKAQVWKLTILGHKNIKNQVVSKLHRSGFVEIVEIKENEAKKSGVQKYDLTEINNDIQEITKKINDLNFATNYLGKFQKPKGFFASMSGGRFEYINDEYIKTVKNFKYNILAKIKRLSSDMNSIESKILSINNRIKELKIWKSIKIDFTDLRNTGENSKILFCSVEKPVYNELLSEVEKEKLTEIEIINEDDDNFYVSILYFADKENKVKGVLSKYNSLIYEFNDIDTTIIKKITEYKNDIKSFEKKLDEINEEIKSYAVYYDEALVCIDYWTNMLKKAEIEKNFSSTSKTFLIHGWIKKKEIDKLKKLLEEYKEIDVIATVPAEDDDVPVVLENKKLVSPFEMVTKLYGAPRKKEIDPTPLFAPFFALYFAICLTDAGYGLVLMGIMAMLLRNKYLSEGTRKLMKVLLISGFFTVIVGIFAGGFFGIDFDKLPASLAWVKHFKDKIAYFDPLKNPLRLFIFVIGLGVFQVVFGYTVKFILLLKEKDYRGAVVDALSWLIIIISLLVGGLLGKSYIMAFSLVGVLIVLLYSSKNKNIIMRLAKGAYGLYDITGIFGDIVSYSRLFALALSTGVIAMVVNVIIMIVFNVMVKVPVIGYPLAVVILIAGLVFGHIFNILINALGAFVHTTRLQFVEFFTKFYEGGGREFSPFKEDLEYVYIKEKK